MPAASAAFASLTHNPKTPSNSRPASFLFAARPGVHAHPPQFRDSRISPTASLTLARARPHLMDHHIGRRSRRRMPGHEDKNALRQTAPMAFYIPLSKRKDQAKRFSPRLNGYQGGEAATAGGQRFGRPESARNSEKNSPSKCLARGAWESAVSRVLAQSQ